MARHVARGLWLLGLSLAVLGCRAFQPEPVIVNRPPDTFIMGAPAETTGTRFLRHLYWYGTDSDGEVVRYIYAITDSTVADPDQEGDEEDARFDPADDITTIQTIRGRRVGFTARTDTTLMFTIDRGSVTSKDVTFHVVAIDDRGAIDPTPARLRFFANSLGNPTFRFSVFTEEAGPEWVLRWRGTPQGPDPGSPERTTSPFVGYQKKFRIDWEASSPNGSILGYRFRASQFASDPLQPTDEQGNPAWMDRTSLVFDNAIPPETIDGCNPRSFQGCPPDVMRFPSGDYAFEVRALDEAKVENLRSSGVLKFEVNYAPETFLDTAEGRPQWVLDDQMQALALGDTVPVGAYVVFQLDGNDQYPSSLPEGSTYGPLCCDQREFPERPEVRFQSKIDLLGELEQGFLNVRGNYSLPRAADTLGFTVGPFHYAYFGRTEDEHARRDRTDVTYSFRGGFPPRVTETIPREGDRLILRSPFSGQRWPESTVDYEVAPGTFRRWWDGFQYHETRGCGGVATCDSMLGNIFLIRPTFRGEVDPRERRAVIRSWSYSVFSEHDPLNLILSGRESSDLSQYTSPDTDNLWEHTAEEAIEVFIPVQIWFEPELFSPGQPAGDWRVGVGREVRRNLGITTLRVKAKTTEPGMKYDARADLDPAFTPNLDLNRFGRRSEVFEQRFEFYLGLDPDNVGQITRLWPDF